MAEAFDVLGIVRQNLKDAGCDKEIEKKCMCLAREGNYKEMLPILLSFRKTLLNAVRSGQKKIDCLDYLIYKIQKENV